MPAIENENNKVDWQLLTDKYPYVALFQFAKFAQMPDSLRNLSDLALYKRDPILFADFYHNIQNIPHHETVLSGNSKNEEIQTIKTHPQNITSKEEIIEHEIITFNIENLQISSLNNKSKSDNQPDPKSQNTEHEAHVGVENKNDDEKLVEALYDISKVDATEPAPIIIENYKDELGKLTEKDLSTVFEIELTSLEIENETTQDGILTETNIVEPHIALQDKKAVNIASNPVESKISLKEVDDKSMDIDKPIESKTDPEDDDKKSLMVMMSFTEWLNHFKTKATREKEEEKSQKALKTAWQKEKLQAAIEEESDEIPESIFKQAMDSISLETDTASEALASILAKQGKTDKAIDMYKKLSLRNPEKSAYFANLINELKS